MSANLASFLISIFVAASPDKALWISLTVVFCVDSTVGFFLMISPEVSVPVDLHFTCKERNESAHERR